MTLRKLIAAGTLATASLSAQAGPIITVSGEGSSASESAESAFLASLGSYTTETFEGETPGAGSQSLSINTAVGSFTMTQAGEGGLCDNGSYDCDNGVAILSQGTTPFSGRFAAKGSANWLDSMDAQQMVFSPLAGVTSVGFYITDPNDAGGRIDIGGFGFSFEDIFGSYLKNGRMFYVTISDAAGLGDLTFYSNNKDDGYGLDNVSVASVPEPGTLALMFAGLLGLVGLRRRVARQC